MSSVRCKSNENNQGFSVLEAIIAMALLAAAILPLLSLQAQFVRTVDSIERADRRLQLRHMALNKIKTINPAELPKGEYIQRDSRVNWEAQSLFPLQALYEGGSQSSNNIALYDINVEIIFDNGGVDRFIVRRLGWELQDNAGGIFE